MEVFVSRQPVFDAGKNVYGYELAYRAGFETYYEALEADKSAVDLMAFVNFGELSGGRKGLIHFPRELLMMDFPLLFAADAMIAVIGGELGNDAEFIARCRELRGKGYQIAVNSFNVDLLAQPIMDVASIVKLGSDKLPEASQKQIIEACKARKIAVMACSLNDEDQFKKAQALGATYFQGDFFSKPDIKKEKKLAANKLVCLQLIQEVNREELSYDKISGLIERDVGMTYNLLKMINSAWSGVRYEIKSVRHALVLLGPSEIRRWASMVAMHKAASDKPNELMQLSLTRAKFAEQLALLAGMKKQAPELFLMGMFSVLDALMDRPMDELLAEVALGENIKMALLGGTGDYKLVYEILLAYEHGHWQLFADLAAALNVDENAIPEMHRSALGWAQQALQASENHG